MQTMVIVGRESRLLARAAARGFKRHCQAKRAAAGVVEAPAQPAVRTGRLADLVRGYLASATNGATIRDIATACSFSDQEPKSLQTTIRRYTDVEPCGERRGGKNQKEVLWRLKGCQRIVGADGTDKNSSDDKPLLSVEELGR